MSKAILFDMDGVIVDSEPLHVAAFQATLADYGHTLSGVDYKEHFAGRTDEAGFEKYFKFLGETVDVPIIMDKKARKYLELAADQLKPYPGVIECIKALDEQGTPLGLVTGSLRAEADVTLETFGITQCFTVVVAAEDISVSKPNPEGYLKAAKALKVAPADCVVVEDAPSGVLAANTAGMRCIAVTTTHAKNELAKASYITKYLNIEMMNKQLEIIK